MKTVYDLANVGIVLGYAVLGILIIPTTKWKHWWTAAGATGFFVTCGIHHAMDITGAMGMNQPSNFMVIDDVIQFIAVWTFFFGLLQERTSELKFKSPLD